MAHISLRTVLEKMDNSDSDYRYMASSDLLTKLKTEAGQRTDSDTQKKLCRSTIKLLRDPNSEVQGMATKCLPPLASFVEDQHACYMVDKLLNFVLETETPANSASSHDNVGVKAMRDVASLGLKSILAEINPDGPKATAISRNALPRLLPAIMAPQANGKVADVVLESLELLRDLLRRMGALFADSHQTINKAIFSQLASESALVRKRAITCLGALGAICNTEIFNNIVEKTISELQAVQSHEKIRTGVQAIWALSKTAGHRLGAHLTVLVPILLGFCTAEEYMEDDELREHCMQALESFSLRCRREMVAFGEQLSTCAISLAKYDPNYVLSDSDEEVGDNDMEDDGEEDGDFEDDDYSDDDDSSWKVRRAAIRCIHAVISSHLLSMSELCTVFGPFLISRFKEREEAVKLDVFAAFTALLRLGKSASRAGLLLQATPGEGSGVDAMAVDGDVGAASELAPLMDRGPQIVRGVKRELGSRSIKTRVRAMTLMREMVAVAPGVITPLVSKIVPEVEQGLADSATAMKTESLLFMRGIVHGGGAEGLREHIGRLMPRVLATADDRYYKITAECLRFCGSSVGAFGQATADCKAAMSPLVASVHDAALMRVVAPDQDSEVKEAALHCIGCTVSYFGRDLGAERLASVASTLCDRLGNDVTRLATVRALHSIALSEQVAVLQPVMDSMTKTVGGFLRKSNPSLRIAALDLLSSTRSLSSENDAMLISNVSELITDADLRLASLALRLSASLVRARPSVVCPLLAEPNSVYSRALGLSVSPLLQGRAVDSLLALFRVLADVNIAPLTIDNMLSGLRDRAMPRESSPVSAVARSLPLHSIAKCVAVICEGANVDIRTKTAKEIIANVTSNDLRSRIFSLSCLGELGRRSLLAKDGDEKERVRGAILSAFDGPAEDLKTAAALALGGLTSADGASGIPTLVALIRHRPNQRYLLLLSLKDVISFAAEPDLCPLVPMLLPLLLETSPNAQTTQPVPEDNQGGQARRSSGEESIRTATAECLGLLTRVAPGAVVPSLSDGTNSELPEVRALVVSAVKFAVSSSPTGAVPSVSLSDNLRPVIGAFVALISDKDVVVSKNALQAVNAIARSRPALLLPHLGTALPRIYDRTVKDKDLVRIVDLGPFKHEEDFGLDLRKSSFDCMRTLLGGPLAPLIPLATFVEKVTVGLTDQADVRSIAQLILTTAASSPSAPQMLPVIGQVVKALEATFNERIKENAVRQETERQEDSIRGALRAVRVMENVPDIASNPLFIGLLTNVVKTSKFLDRYQSIGKSEIEMLTLGNLIGVDAGFDHDAMITD